METTLHQHSGTTHLQGFCDFLVNCFEVEDVTFGCQLALERSIKGAKAAVLGTKICIVDIAVDDVRYHAFGVEFASERVGFHTQADEVIRAKIVKSLGSANSHLSILRVWLRTIQCYSSIGPKPTPPAKVSC